MLHIEDRLSRWSRSAALTMGHLFAEICGRDLFEKSANSLYRVTGQLTLELLKKQLDHDEDDDVANIFLGRTIFAQIIGQPDLVRI